MPSFTRARRDIPCVPEEELMGFTKVLTEDTDLVSVGMKPLQRRRFQQAALELRT